MTLAWAAYCVVVAALLGLAAGVGEWALRRLGRPVRWVWVGSILGSLALPLASWLGWLPGKGNLSWSVPEVAGGIRPEVELGSVSQVPSDLPPVAVTPAPALPDPTVAAPTPFWESLPLDRLLLVFVVLSTVAVLLFISNSIWSLRRARAGWRQDVLEGIPVLVSEAVGPAALGVIRGEIVVPEWVYSLEARLRRLLLQHEAEHLRAGDPRLLLASLLAVAMMPWNPVLWWQFRRLCQALELDCDARVLRRESDLRSYGLLLLEVGRRPGQRIQLLPAFAESQTLLERRIRMLGQTNRSRGRAMAVGGVGVALMLLVLAGAAPQPTQQVAPVSLTAVMDTTCRPGSVGGSRRLSDELTMVGMTTHDSTGTYIDAMMLVRGAKGWDHLPFPPATETLAQIYRGAGGTAGPFLFIYNSATDSARIFFYHELDDGTVLEDYNGLTLDGKNIVLVDFQDLRALPKIVGTIRVEGVLPRRPGSCGVPLNPETADQFTEAIRAHLENDPRVRDFIGGLTRS